MAAKAVIMSDDPTLSKKEGQTVAHEMLDAKSIFIYKAIKRINPTLQILTELNYESNIDFLQAKKGSKTSVAAPKIYAAGEVYISSIIDTLTG